MAEQPLPFGASSGLPGGVGDDLLSRMAQAEPGPLQAGRAGPSSELERFRRMQPADPLEPGISETELLPRLGAQIQVNPFQVTAEQLEARAENLRIKMARMAAEAEAREKTKKAVREGARGMEIASEMAGVRRNAPELILPARQSALASEATKALDAQETLQDRLEALSGTAEAGSEIARALIAEAEAAATDPDRISLEKAKDLLVGLRLKTEVDRAKGREGVFNAGGIEKNLRKFLDAAGPDNVRAMLKVELGRSVAERKSRPGMVLDALLASPLGERKMHMASRSFAAGLTFDVSEAVMTGILGERGLAEELAGGIDGDKVASMLGFVAGAMTNFVALDRFLVKKGVKTFANREWPERLAIETVMQDIPRIPAIVLNGRIQGLSNDQITKQIGIEVGLGLLAGSLLGLGGAAASYTTRELGRQVSRGAKGLGRIAREAPEKLPAILDVADSMADVATTMVSGVSGKSPVFPLRNKSQLRRMIRASQESIGLSAGQLGKIIREVAPKRGKTGDLGKLSIRELRGVSRRLLAPDDAASGVPRGTSVRVLPGGEVTEQEHVFFAVPAEQAQPLRRGGMVPTGTSFHARPNQAARQQLKRNKAVEVFAMQRTTLQELEQGVSLRDLDLDENALSKTVHRGRLPVGDAQLSGFANKGGPFGLDPIDMLMSEPIHGQSRPLSDELGRVGRAVEPVMAKARNAMRRLAYGEAAYGMSRRMLEAMAPEHGPRFSQMLDQHAEMGAAISGPFEPRYQDIVRNLNAKEINQVELMADARIPPPAPDDASPVAKAYRARIKHNADFMDEIERPNPDGTVVRKADGSEFRRADVYMPQPVSMDVVEAVETASHMDMRLKMDPSREGRFAFFDEAKGKFTKLPVTGNLLKRQQKRIQIYNEFISDVARQMDEQGMRYKAAEKDKPGSFMTGVTDKATRAELKMQARAFYKDHRDVLAAQQYTRPFTPAERDIIENAETFGKPRKFGAVDFARRFKYDERFLRPHFGDNYMRHIRQMADRKSESVVFGENLERFGQVMKDVVDDVNDRLGENEAKRAATIMRQLYARETGNLAVDATIDALQFHRKSEQSQFIRNLTAGLFLGPGSTFVSGGNAVFAVFGAFTRLPVKQWPAAMDSFAFGELAATGLGAFAGSEIGKRLGDTPEERERMANLLMVAGGSAGFGASLFRDSTVRALTPVAAQAAGTILGFEAAGEDASPLVRRLTTAAGFLTGFGVGRTRTARRIAASPTAVRSAQAAGAVFGNIRQSDLVTNALAPAFKGESGPIGTFLKAVAFDATQAWEVWARSSSARAGLAAASEMVDKLAKDPGLRNQKLGKFFLRELERVGLDRETVSKIIDNNSAVIPDALSERVMRQFVDNTQYSLRPLNLPIAWTSPSGRVYTQFMGMQYRQYFNTFRYALEEAGFGHWMPIFKIPIMAVGAGWTVQEFRNYMNGENITPGMRGKFVRFVQILSPITGLFEVPLRFLSRVVEGAGPGRAAVEAVLPPSVDAAEQMVDLLFSSAREMIFNDPDVRRGRTGVERGARAIPAERLFQTAIQTRFPTDEDRIRQFVDQMARAEQQVIAARRGFSMTEFLRQIPETETPPGSPLRPIRELAERAAGPVEDAARNAATGLGFLPVAPSKRTAEANAQAIFDRLRTAPGLLEREKERRERIFGRETTKGDVLQSLQREASAKNRPLFIDRIFQGARDGDDQVVQDNAERYLESGGTASALIGALRRRTLNQRDEAVERFLLEKLNETALHRLELRLHNASELDMLLELDRRPSNPSRLEALIQESGNR